MHTPQHVRSLTDLDGEQLDLVAEAWRARWAAVHGAYMHALVNEGREAGSSLPHTHSQLVWLPETPTEAQHAVDRSRWEVVLERDGLVVACPWVSRLAYECVIAPAEPQAHAFRSELLAPALRLLAETIRRVRVAAGPAPVNAWVHDGPNWRVELGAGWWINALPPEEAADVLRSVSPV